MLPAMSFTWTASASRPLMRSKSSTDTRPTPDGLSALPKDYVAPAPDKPAPTIPRLGPPVPGDFGRPASAPGADLDADQQRLAQETEAARTNHLFATTGARERSATPEPTPFAPDQKPPSPGQPDAAPLDQGAPQNMQDRKALFAAGPVDRKTVSTDPPGLPGYPRRDPGRFGHSGGADHRHPL